MAHRGCSIDTCQRKEGREVWREGERELRMKGWVCGGRDGGWRGIWMGEWKERWMGGGVEGGMGGWREGWMRRLLLTLAS